MKKILAILIPAVIASLLPTATGLARIASSTVAGEKSSAPAEDPEKQCRQIFYRYRCPLAVGITDRSGTHVFAYGKDAYGHPVTGDSEFETASISKVFTGLLLALSIESHEVGLNEPVRNILGSVVPDFDGGPITFKQLATHMSGLPDWPTNRGSTTSPYSTAAMKTYLRKAKREDQPGDMTYSNTGYALLGMALSEKTKQPFESLVLKRVCSPLGMKSTRVNLTPEMKLRLVRGHNAQGRQLGSSSPTAGGGADGIRSTPNDLLKFVAAYAGITPSPLAQSFKLSYAIHETINDEDDIGFAWYIRKPSGIVWKGGNIAGYKSFVAFQPEKHIGLVILSGSNAFPACEFGQKLMLTLCR